jgi:hypothetical protein
MKFLMVVILMHVISVPFLSNDRGSLVVTPYRVQRLLLVGLQACTVAASMLNKSGLTEGFVFKVVVWLGARLFTGS